LFDAEDAVQGNSVQSAQKKAWFKDAAGGQHELSVPQFIKKGEKIIISTSTGLYVGRSKE
jgi:elongation factor P